MKISTISIAEYCTGGKIDELPLKFLQILPFNVQHAKGPVNLPELYSVTGKN